MWPHGTDFGYMSMDIYAYAPMHPSTHAPMHPCTHPPTMQRSDLDADILIAAVTTFSAAMMTTVAVGIEVERQRQRRRNLPVKHRPRYRRRLGHLGTLRIRYDWEWSKSLDLNCVIHSVLWYAVEYACHDTYTLVINVKR